VPETSTGCIDRIEPLSVDDGCEFGEGEGITVVLGVIDGEIMFCAPKTPGVGVLVGVGVRVAVGVGVFEGTGVFDGVGLLVCVGVGVRVGEGVIVGVFEGVIVGVCVGVLVGVNVGVSVGVFVGVGEGIVVGLGAISGTVCTSESSRNPCGDLAVTSVGIVNDPVNCSTVAV
jgi:hypothetical protein